MATVRVPSVAVWLNWVSPQSPLAYKLIQMGASVGLVSRFSPTPKENRISQIGDPREETESDKKTR